MIWRIGESSIIRSLISLLLCSLGFVGTAALAAVATTFAEDVGYAVLQAELGAAVPDGTGMTVTIVEACNGNPCAWAPDPGSRSITDGDGVMQVTAPFSSHANSVGDRFYGDGSTTSAIGVLPNPSISAYEANAWIQGDFLRFGQTYSLPLSTSSRIANHSWVGATGSDAYDLELLRRIDWLIDEDEYVQVVGFTGNSSPLFGSALNAIAVNKTGTLSSNLSWPVTGDPVYSVRHARPALVAPENNTSNATPRVSSAAALLMSVAHADPLLSNGSTTNRENDTVMNAERSEVIKAALMAGAERATNNTHPTSDPANLVNYRIDPADQTSNGLDRRYGAGQLNVYNSYHVIAAGEQDSVESNGVGSIAKTGFDYDAAFGGSSGSNSEGTYFFTTGSEDIEFIVSLVWNLNVSKGNWGSYFQSAATLYDLDLNLYDISDGGNWVLVTGSTSSSENTENIRAFLKADTPYAMQVNRGSGQSSFRWDYGLAWRTRINGDVNGDDMIDIKDLMFMEQAIIGSRNLDQQQRARADVYPVGGDGSVNVSDLLMLQKIVQTP